MSECTLYVLDAPSIKTAEAAGLYIENADEAEETAASAPLQSFFDELLLAFPDDGSETSVWYEGFAHNRPSGTAMPLYFLLDVMDEELLGRLRELAARHGLHVFDPEGSVLYLSDGSEDAD